MSDHNHTHTRETHVEKRGSSATLAFIVGALVVAVLVLAWLVFGGDADTASQGGGDVSVTIEGAGEAVEGAVEDATGAATGNE